MTHSVPVSVSQPESRVMFPATGVPLIAAPAIAAPAAPPARLPCSRMSRRRPARSRQQPRYRQRWFSQVEIVHLADQVGPEAVVRFLLREGEPTGQVDLPRCDQRVVGPQFHPLIAGFPSEAQALID
jgi:hypothetical protein